MLSISSLRAKPFVSARESCSHRRSFINCRLANSSSATNTSTAQQSTSNAPSYTLSTRSCNVITRAAAVEAPAETITDIDSEKLARSIVRVTLKSFLVPELEEACDIVLMAAAVSGARASGPVYLPTRKKLYCVLRSPHVNKDAREHFEIRTHKRLIDIHDFGAETIESLLQMDLPAGVDVQVEVKLGTGKKLVLL